MKKPVYELNELRPYASGLWKAVFNYADSIPEDAYMCAWPADLTRERLEELVAGSAYSHAADALSRLAAIAPKREKRRVEIWEDANGELHVRAPGHALPAWTKKGECEVDA